jgi:adenine phosphoribosyltransferase
LLNRDSKTDWRKFVADFSHYIRHIPNFPKPGIVFKDITPLLKEPGVFHDAIDAMATHFEPKNIDVVVSIDARGFIFGAALAYRMGIGFVPVRKGGKLPYKTYEATYDLEYGTDTLAIHQDAIAKGGRVLICDDVIATGGTLTASIELVEKLGGEVVGIGVLIELISLAGRQKLADYEIFSLIEF